MLKKLLILVLAAAFVTALAGCNTLEGFGKDIEELGEGLQDAAD